MLVLRRKKVRIHQSDGPTIEGILVGSLDSHYRLLKPKVIASVSESYDLTGEALVPREKVIFVEVVR